MKLSYQDEAIAQFLEKYHGVDNPILMKDLGNVFKITGRDVRKSIERIILNQRLVIGSNIRSNNKNGYWVAAVGEENLANAIPKSRIKKSLRRLAANKGDIKWVYKYLKELENEYPNYHHNQLYINIEKVNEVQS